MTHRDQPQTIKSTDAVCTVRRFSGPEANELFILCRPNTAAAGDACAQTESIYQMLHDALRAEGGDMRHVVHETIFFRNILEDLDDFQQVRSGLLRQLSGHRSRPAATWIEQPPLNERERLEVAAFAIIPRQRGAEFGRTLLSLQPCACAVPTRFATRIVRVGAQEYLYAGSIYGADGTVFDEAFSMFRAAEHALEQQGLSFQHVVRTWIHLRDIDRDYAEFNQARREFFRRSGVTLHPASTGIEGAPFPERHRFSLSLYAIKSPAPLEVGLMTTPTLNEAWMYGSDFSRGLKVVEANKVALYVSGTASVDEEGRTAHEGDFAAQVDRMLTNVSTLLSAQNASFHDMVTAVTYLKSAADGARLREILHDRGIEGFPNALVKAAVCRPDLLCEMEGIAALPRPQTGE